MNISADLPAKLDPNEPEMPSWDGDVGSIPELLNERKRMAANNFYAHFKVEGAHPFCRRLRKEVKQYSRVIIEREAVAQVEFKAAIASAYEEERLKVVNESSDWDKPRRLTKLEKNFGGSNIEGLPA